MRLTVRQVQIMQLVLANKTTKAIAMHLGLSPSTVLTHLTNVQERLGARNTADAVRIFMQEADTIMRAESE